MSEENLGIGEGSASKGGGRSSNKRGGGGGGSSGGKVFLHRSSVIESNGPQGKVRGTAQQLVDRYVIGGRNAARGGDPVLAEKMFQYAEHYRRMLSSIPGGKKDDHNGAGGNAKNRAARSNETEAFCEGEDGTCPASSSNESGAMGNEELSPFSDED